MKKYYVTWINKTLYGGELTEAETADDAIINVIQRIIERECGWFNDYGKKIYERIEIDIVMPRDDIIVWGVVDGNKIFIRYYLDFKAIIADEKDAE